MEENNNLNETNKETNDKSIKESLEFKPIVQESITNNDFNIVGDILQYLN